MAQPDSIIPDPYNPLDWNRYSYSRYNPLRYSDPSGHSVCDVTGANPECVGLIINRRPSNPPINLPSKNNNITGKASAKGISQETLTPITDFVNNQVPWSASTWGDISKGLDVLAWLTDLYAVSAVTYGGIAGAGLASPLLLTGLPEVPVATGWAGAAIAELYVQPVIRTGNTLAVFSTTATYISETKAGNTVIETGQLSNPTKNSGVLTVLALLAPQEAYISFVFQSTAVLNDFGILSIPFR